MTVQRAKDPRTKPRDRGCKINAQFSTKAGCISADQRRIGDNLDKHIAAVAENFNNLFVLIGNQSAIIEQLKARQAVSGAFQAVSLAILILWLIALAIRAIWVCVTKKQQANQEEMVEMLEASLARRKAKRRAMGKQTSETNQ